MLLSYIDIIPQKYVDNFNKIPQISLVIILFLMGAKIGMDSNIIQNIAVVGLKALILAIGSIFGSLTCIKLFIRKTPISNENTGIPMERKEQ